MSLSGTRWRFGRSAVRVWIFAALTVVASALLAGLPARADAASSCLTLSAATDAVPAGGALRLDGRACEAAGVGRVRIIVRRGDRSSVAARSRVGLKGRFSGRVQVPVSGGFVSLKAQMSGFASESLKVQIINGRGADGEALGQNPISQSEAAPVQSPPAPDPDPASPDCPLSGSQPGPAVGMSLDDCRLIASDTASTQDPNSFWGFLACQNSSRQQLISGSADPHPTALGNAQTDTSYRRLSVLDGDNPFGWGERCELGENDHQGSPTAFYREGKRRVTYLSMRLPTNLPHETSAWQTVMQMKQAQPADAGGGVPILFMNAMNGNWVVDSYQGAHWTFPAQRNVWTRFAYDVFYSQDPGRGWLQVSADLNADGDFDDGNERSPVIRTATLKAETDGPNGTSDGLAPGDSIPSHLRAGVYHNPSIPCPPPGGCSTEVDNVQVVAP